MIIAARVEKKDGLWWYRVVQRGRGGFSVLGTTGTEAKADQRAREIRLTAQADLPEPRFPFDLDTERQIMRARIGDRERLLVRAEQEEWDEEDVSDLRREVTVLTRLLRRWDRLAARIFGA